jgi:hypothetical protein
MALAETEPGVFEAATTTTQAGVYRFHILAAGRTFRGRPFTREQLASGAVWKGGDHPPPSSPPGSTEKPDRDICRLLACLLKDDVMTPELQKRLEGLGINLDALRRCVEGWCKRSGDRSPGASTTLLEALKSEELRKLVDAMAVMLRR